jgi:hypothetical protein
VIHTTQLIHRVLTYPPHNTPARVNVLLLPSAYTPDQPYKEGCLNITAALIAEAQLISKAEIIVKEKGVVKFQYEKFTSFMVS